MQRPGGLLRGIVRLPDGTLLNATTELTLITSSGFVLTTAVVGGVFSLALPLGTVVTPVLNTTVTSLGPGGFSQEGTYRTSPGVTCTVRSAQSNCTVSLHGAQDLISVSGPVNDAAYAGPLTGTVRFIGPSPQVVATEVQIRSGSFETSLLPGSYAVYATVHEGGITLASLGQAVVSVYPSMVLPITVGPTWTDSLLLTSTGSGTASTANLTVSGPLGAHMVLTGEPIGTSIVLALTPGVWTLRANSSATPYGVRASTTGSATVSLISGNAATIIPLTPVLTRQVAFQLQGPHTATVLPGSTWSLSYSLTNTGNTPLSLHMVGTPSTWTFNFTPENVSLGVADSNRTSTGELLIHLPANTPTNVPPITLEAVLSDGTIAGIATPAPTLTVRPYYGIEIGGSPQLGTVGSDSTTLPFWAMDTGNTPEIVSFAVPNLASISGLGWTAQIMSGTSPVLSPVTLSPGTNTSYHVLLTSGPDNPLIPGTVRVVATVQNASATASASLVIGVSDLPLTISNNTLTVTGPGLGTPPAYPGWVVYPLVFVPAAAVLLFMVTFRWYRSRRWHR
ncbi:MAG: hypothetical protein ACYDFT_01760 [Thermoplasmata archaeon]